MFIQNWDSGLPIQPPITSTSFSEEQHLYSLYAGRLINVLAKNADKLRSLIRYLPILARILFVVRCPGGERMVVACGVLLSLETLGYRNDAQEGVLWRFPWIKYMILLCAGAMVIVVVVFPGWLISSVFFFLFLINQKG